MKAEDIENYLSQLGQELLKRGIQEPIHLLLIGGAYILLLTNTSRTTDDIDIFWLEEEGRQWASTRGMRCAYSFGSASSKSSP